MRPNAPDALGALPAPNLLASEKSEIENSDALAVKSRDQDSLVCFGLAQNCYDIYIGCPQSTTLVYANIAENCYSIDRGCM